MRLLKQPLLKKSKQRNYIKKQKVELKVQPFVFYLIAFLMEQYREFLFEWMFFL